MLSDVNLALEKELLRVQEDRQKCISMLSKLLGDGKTTAEIMASLETSVEKINEDDISNHVTRKTTLLSKIIGLKLNAVEELRLRTYSARQKVIAANVQEKKKKNPTIVPTLSEFWKAEIAVQQAEVRRLQKLCKSTVEQQHPLLELASGTLGLTKSDSLEGTKRGKKKNQGVLGGC